MTSLPPGATVDAPSPRSPREALPHARHRWAPPLVAGLLLLLVLVSLQPPPAGGGGGTGSEAGQAEVRGEAGHSSAPLDARPAEEAKARPALESGAAGAPPAAALAAAEALAAAAAPAAAPASQPAPAAASESAQRAEKSAQAASAGALPRPRAAPLPALGFATDFAAANRPPEPPRPPAPPAPTAASPAASFEPAGGSGTAGLATFFGAPGHGSRFVYVIDKSGSMSGAPFETAKRELLRSLRSLRPHERFFVIFYDGEAERMPGAGLVSATPSNIEQAVAWVRSVSVGGDTNPNEALRFALDELRPDTIWLLSDGQFPVDVLETITAHNLGRRTHINTLAFLSRSGEALLKIIADQNRGDHRFVAGP